MGFTTVLLLLLTAASHMTMLSLFSRNSPLFSRSCPGSGQFLGISGVPRPARTAVRRAFPRAPGLGRHEGYRPARHRRGHSALLSDRDGTPRTSLSMREDEWRAAAEQEREKVLEMLGGELRTGGRKGTKHHPIFNFIFEYYMFKPKILLQYSPGLGVSLEGAEEGEATLPTRGVKFNSSMAWIDPSLAKPKTVDALRWTRDLLKATRDRKPELHCYGLHEWAMLYHPEDSQNPPPKKYQDLPLRISQAELNSAVTEGTPIRCTHFDAFRFFTPDAKGFNDIQPTREMQPSIEQPGCLHANMDLFKWSVKLFPWIPSSLLHQTLLLAIKARTLDMRASPYDVQRVGKEAEIDASIDLSPVRIETPGGRAIYQKLQADLWREAIPIRDQVIEAYDRFLAEHDGTHELDEPQT